MSNWAPSLVPKGYDVLNDYHRYLLLHGPRKTAKTTTIVSKVCRHLWENDGAMFAILGKSIKSIKSSGTWQDFVVHRTGVRQWLDAGIGFKYDVEPKLTGDTKMTYFRIRNMFGTVSECQIHSLEHDQQVEEKFKNTRYSGFYIVEADLFKDPNVFLALDDQLRSYTVPENNLQIILDCNPADEGDEHWIYKYFIRHVDFRENALEPEYAALFQHYLFLPEDNPFLTPMELSILKSKYAHDTIKHARYVLGQWKKDNDRGIFHNIWSEERHVVGNTSHPDDEQWEILIPGPNSIEMVTGWDIGDVNHAWVLACPRAGGENTVFDVIDELMAIDEPTSIVEFTEGVMERMTFWTEALKQLYGHKQLLWRHWSDASVMRYRSASDEYDFQIIKNASGGHIVLTPVSKPAGSVKQRVDLVKKLTCDNRIVLSASCRAGIDMYRHLRRGTTSACYIRKGSLQKHWFDAFSYMLANEAPTDMERRNQEHTTKRARIVSI